MPITSTPILGPQTDLAQSDLTQSIPNILYWIARNPAAGSTTAAGTTLKASTVAASAAINTTETVIASIPVLAGVTLKVGTVVRATFAGTCTDTVANTSTFALRAGILGTVADAAVATWVTSASGTAGTNIPFQAVVEFTVQTLAATGTAFGNLTVVSPATGIIGAATGFVVGSAAAITALPTTTATFLDFTYVSAATTTTSTFQNCSIEIIV